MSTPAFESTDRPPEIGDYVVLVPISHVVDLHAPGVEPESPYAKSFLEESSDQQLTKRQDRIRVIAPISALHSNGASRQLQSSLALVRIALRNGRLSEPGLQDAFALQTIPTHKEGLEQLKKQHSGPEVEAAKLAALVRYLGVRLEIDTPRELTFEACDHFVHQPAVQELQRQALGRQAPSVSGIRM